MTDAAEFERLVANLPRNPIPVEVVLSAGRALGIEWPAEYIALASSHDGVEGEIGDWLLVLQRVEDLVELNTDAVMEFFPGLVIIGGDGGGEALAIDRETGEILLAPWIGGEDDWLILGANLTEAFQRMERGEVFDAPMRSGPEA